MTHIIGLTIFSNHKLTDNLKSLVSSLFPFGLLQQIIWGFAWGGSKANLGIQQET